METMNRLEEKIKNHFGDINSTNFSGIFLFYVSFPITKENILT